MTAAHPLDLVWATLSTNEQRMHAAAEARAFYRQTSREWDAEGRAAFIAAFMDASVSSLVDAICPPLPGRPKRGEHA
jgi:hypothetical protein